MVCQGIYRHYKGNFYQVIGYARHSETLEKLVVYQMLYGDYGLWVRPAAMFAEYVQVGDMLMQRFTYVGSGTTLPTVIAGEHEKSN